MKHLIFTLVFLSLFNLSAQTNFNSKDLNVTHHDLKINTYPKDSTANALVLYEYGKTYVDKKTFRLVTVQKRKIKILKREGFKKASVSIYLYKTKDRSEKIEEIIASTYNLVDNKTVITRLEKNNIFEEKYDKNNTIIKFTLPNIKEGSVITYSYKLISPFDYNFKGWSFQSDVPTLYSEYRTSIPANWEYNIKLVGSLNLSETDNSIKPRCISIPNTVVQAFKSNDDLYADCFEAFYIMKDVPAFKEEDYMTTKNNYLSRIDYELKTFKWFDGTVKHFTKSWKTVDKELKTDRDIGKQLSKSINLENHLSNDIVNEIDDLKKADAIFKYVQDTYTWNGDYKIFKDVSVKNLIKNKSGNVSSINILLHNLLEEADLKVKPVLVSTRENGFPTKIYPVLSDFNYLIVQLILNGKTYFLDASENYLNFGELPFRCLNHNGRLLDFKKGSQWIDIVSKKPSIAQYKAELQINDNNIILGKINSRTTGYHALRRKKAYYENSDLYIKTLQDNQPYIEIFDHEVSSEGKTSTDFKEAYNVEFEDEIDSEKTYLNPFLVTFFKENPFKLQERTYPIDFGFKDIYYYMFKLDLGENYSVLEKPKDINIALPNNKGSFLFSSSLKGNTVNILFKLSFKEALYAPEYYPYLKEFMNKVVDVQTNSILILNKK